MTVMASVKFYLDKRAKRQDGTFPLKLTVTHKKPFHIPLDVSIPVENWIDNKIEGKIKNKVFLNNYIQARYTEIHNLLLNLKINGILPTITSEQLKQKIKALSGVPEEEMETKGICELHFKTYIENYIKNCNSKSSKTQYTYTLKKVASFCNVEKLLISDITVSWLKDFDAYCTSTGMQPNGKALYLRAIRTIFNDAIDRELIGYEKYPFRRFKIKKTETPHRNISIKGLRKMVNFDAEKFLELQKTNKKKKNTCKFHEIQKYIDLFFLSFYLCGINIKDLLFLKSEDVSNGQISILRAKTSIPILLRIEPEAQKLIDKHKGDKFLLNFLDTYTTNDYRNLEKRMNKNIQLAFPGVTGYWARHSWATIAAELDIPDHIIDIAQGRKPVGMASVYINRNLKKISQANRKVINYLNRNNK